MKILAALKTRINKAQHSSILNGIKVVNFLKKTFHNITVFGKPKGIFQKKTLITYIEMVKKKLQITPHFTNKFSTQKLHNLKIYCQEIFQKIWQYFLQVKPQIINQIWLFCYNPKLNYFRASFNWLALCVISSFTYWFLNREHFQIVLKSEINIPQYIVNNPWILVSIFTICILIVNIIKSRLLNLFSAIIFGRFNWDFFQLLTQGQWIDIIYDTPSFHLQKIYNHYEKKQYIQKCIEIYSKEYALPPSSVIDPAINHLANLCDNLKEINTTVKQFFVNLANTRAAEIKATKKNVEVPADPNLEVTSSLWDDYWWLFVIGGVIILGLWCYGMTLTPTSSTSIMPTPNVGIPIDFMSIVRNACREYNVSLSGFFRAVREVYPKTTSISYGNIIIYLFEKSGSTVKKFTRLVVEILRDHC